MAIKTYDIGPGTLTVGAAPLNVGAQITSCRVETSESVTSTDAIPVLSGEELAGTERVEFTHTLRANVFQDFDAAGLVAYSYAQAGNWVPCVFTPSTARGMKITGQVCIVPVTIGGDVTGTAAKRGENPRSDITWRLKPNTTIAAMFTAGT